MANIKVPIGKRFEERERFLEKMTQQPTSDIQFFKKLADEGKIIVRTGTTSLAGSRDIVEFTVPQGSTFYLLDTSCTAANGGDVVLDFTNPTEQIDFQSFPAVNTNVQFKIKSVSLVGNGIRGVLIRTISNGASQLDCTLEGYIEHSETLSTRGTSTAS